MVYVLEYIVWEQNGVCGMVDNLQFDKITGMCFIDGEIDLEILVLNIMCYVWS